jgi:hypothetical protein
MNIPKAILAGMLTVSLCSGALVKKTINLSEDGGIDIEKNKTTNLALDCVSGPVSPVGTCHRRDCDSSDLFFENTGFWDNFAEGCGGTILSIQSNDTLRELKNFTAIDFNNPLPVTDTSLFVNVRRDSSRCTTWTVQCPYFENPCPPLPWSAPLPTWYIGKTNEGNYFLFKFYNRGIVHEAVTGESREVVTMYYILQTDGSLNFRDAPAAVLNSERQTHPSDKYSGPALEKRFGIPSAVQRCDKIYDVRGRLITAARSQKKAMNHAPQVFIVKRAIGP